MTINYLIKKITPFYNEYKSKQKSLSGTQALQIIWDVGDILKKFLDRKKGLAPRTLYHQIYGKSEGNVDIVQKSYITRDFLDRAYRVRRIFKKKNEIQKTLPTLQRYRLFYKSMPFFDQGKYKMDYSDRKKLLKLLNSKKTYKEIIKEVTKLRKERIALSIPHDSKLKEIEEEKEIFINFYNTIYKQIVKKNYNKTIQNIGEFDTEFLAALSKNTGALVGDNLQMTKFQISDKLKKEWQDFANVILQLTSRKDAKVRRRFRRLIPPNKMIKLSEMIYALRTKEDFDKFRV